MHKRHITQLELIHIQTGFLTAHQTIKVYCLTGSTSNNYDVCSTAVATIEKAVTLTAGTFNLDTGARVIVKFSNTNTAVNPTLNVASKGAKKYNKAILLYLQGH